jgi:hypothetical protein
MLQTFPQPPQFFASLLGSKQRLPQARVPTLHCDPRQAPSMQATSASHT